VGQVEARRDSERRYGWARMAEGEGGWWVGSGKKEGADFEKVEHRTNMLPIYGHVRFVTGPRNQTLRLWKLIGLLFTRIWVSMHVNRILVDITYGCYAFP
jgi:hypothetical protein